jgi:hypothetical protein
VGAKKKTSVDLIVLNPLCIMQGRKHIFCSWERFVVHSRLECAAGFHDQLVHIPVLETFPVRGQCVQGCFIRGRIERGRKRINNRVAQRSETTGTWAHSAEGTRKGTRADVCGITKWFLPLQTKLILM